MGSTPSKQRSSLRRTLSSRSHTKKPTLDNTNLLTGFVKNNDDVSPKSHSSENATKSYHNFHNMSSEQETGHADNVVMLRYTVYCKNEHSDPIDIVVIEDENEVGSVVRKKIAPGGAASFEVLVFKKPLDGKVYVHV